LLRGRVSFFKALRRLSPNNSLLQLGVRSYMAWDARVLTISDKDYASVLALLRGRVSFFKALRRLSPNNSLLQLGVRSYMAWHARVLAISDKDE
jgi:hypothetical protein